MLHLYSKSLRGLVLRVAALTLLLTGFLSELSAQRTVVNSISELRTRINAAQPGDTIVVADGTYTLTGDIDVRNVIGTAERPIVVMSETLGGAVFRGRGTFDLHQPSKYIVIHGFTFNHEGVRGAYNSATFCTFSNNVFECPQPADRNESSSASYLKFWGGNNLITHNTFRNKNYRGPILSIQMNKANRTGRDNVVSYNHFVDFPDKGTNDNAAIQPGYNADRQGDANLIVEHNLFERLEADAEGVMSVKSNNVTFRYNTVRDCNGVSLRDGTGSKVYGNYFFGGSSQGVRFAHNDHQIYNNVFVGVSTAVRMFSRRDSNQSSGFSHKPAQNCFVGYNTMIDCRTGVGHSGTAGSDNLEIVNNVFFDCNNSVTLSGESWRNPVLYGNVIADSPVNALTDSAYTRLNPAYQIDADGIARITENSPLRGIARGDFSFVTEDVDRHARTGPKDAGADQFSTAPSMNLPLYPADVGPLANLAGGQLVQRIPGAFEAEAFTGGTVVTTDTTSDGGGGRALSNITAGGFTTYTVNVQRTTDYAVSYRVASASSDIGINLSMNGQNLGGVSRGATGGDEVWVELKDTVRLEAGTRELRLDFPSGGWRFNSVSFAELVLVIAPNVSFTVPGDTLTVEVGYDIELEALARDDDGTIANVRLYRDGQLVRQESRAPYTWGHDTAPDPNEVNGLGIGTYTFTAIATDNENNMSRDSFVLNVVAEGTVSTNEQQRLAARLNLFPNPASDVITLSGLPAGDVTATAFDLTGRRVDAALLSRERGTLRYDVSRLRRGTYLLRVSVDGVSTAVRFVRM